MIETQAHGKKTKLQIPWVFNIPKRYKWNTIKEELYRAKRISLNFANEVILTENKFKSAGYPMRFVNSVMHESTTIQAKEDNVFIIQSRLFEVKKKTVILEISSCLKN